jgi:protein tyrosine phosphatase (PTP) superfamily phosphohydrolase (DUF442 family)
MLSRRSLQLFSFIVWCLTIAGLQGCRTKTAEPEPLTPQPAAPTSAAPQAEAPQAAPATGTLVSTSLGSTPNVHSHNTTLLCGQPSQEDLALAKQQGIQVVLSLRGEDEIDWDEQAVAEQLGLQFKRVEFHDPETLTDDVIAQTREILRNGQENNQPVMVHCGSANRVGAVWFVHRVLDQEVPIEQAEQEAREVGLRNEAYLQRAMEYIEQQK